MKKILLILIGITIISSTILAQSGWFWQNPLPQGNSLSSARLINSDINYLAGGAGTIVKTTDGGNSWSFINSGTTENILGLHFVNETTGLVVTNTQIRRTTNQGINWNVVYQYSSSLRSLNFINDNTGIVTGNFGLIAKTTNGGLNFIFSSAGNNPDLKMGCLFNNFGLVVSQEIYRTTNGGSNWTMVYFGNDYFNSVYIVDQNNAFAVGTGGKILKTTNSGLNWTNQPSGITADLESIFFTDINTGYAVGLFGTILKTTNSGTIWYPLTSSTNFLLNEIKFTNLTTGLVTGEAGKILKTTNSGDSWQTISIGSNRNINDISFIDNNTGYAVGNNGTILKTTNGGINWNILISNTVEHLNALMLINPDLIYVIGNNSTLIRSDNGGLNWLSQTISVGNVNLTGVSFIDMNTGAVVGTSTIGAYAYFTTNGGTVWIEKGSFGGSLNDVEFVNSSTGFAIDSYGKIYKTTNSGTNWSVYSLTINEQLNGIDFVNMTTGIAVGSNGSAVLTTNSGNNWLILTTGIANRNLNDVKMYSSNLVFAVGDYGVVVKSNNGGANWLNLFAGTYNNFHSICFVDSLTLNASGFAGMILKTTNGGIPVGVNIVSDILPTTFLLYQNYPNPFNPDTKIRFDIPTQNLNGVFVKLIVFDILGREISTLVNEQLKAGSYEVEWKGSNFSSGIYFYSLMSYNFIQTRKLVLIK